MLHLQPLVRIDLYSFFLRGLFLFIYLFIYLFLFLHLILANSKSF